MLRILITALVLALSPALAQAASTSGSLPVQVVPVANQGIAATSMTCSLSCTYVPGSPGVVGTLATGMSPVTPAFAGSYKLVASGCTDPGDTTHFSLNGSTVNTTAPPAGTYHICVQTNQSGMSPIYSDITVVGSAISNVAAAMSSFTWSTVDGTGDDGVGTIVMSSPTALTGVGNRIYITGATNNCTSQATLGWCGPVTGAFVVASFADSQHFTIPMSTVINGTNYGVGIFASSLGPGSVAWKAVGMTTLTCGGFLGADPCTFPAGAGAVNSSGYGVSVFGLTTAAIPADPTFGPYYNQPWVGGTTATYTMVASNPVCPDPGDTTHFVFAHKYGSGTTAGGTTEGLRDGLVPMSGTVAGIYHICLQADIPGAANTPQYQEVTLTAANDNITGIMPSIFTFTTDASSYGAILQVACLSAVSPQCATSGWTMTSNPNFSITNLGVITPTGPLAAGTYPLALSIGGVGPFTLTVNVVAPTNWNGGSYAGIMTEFPSLSSAHSPALTFFGRSDASQAFASTSGVVPCDHDLPKSIATSCGPDGGYIQYGYVKSLGGAGIPAVTTFGQLSGQANWNPDDFGGGSHTNECGAGYYDYFREAALNTPNFVQSMTNALQIAFASMAPQTYFMRLNWEGIEGGWYCWTPNSYGCQLTGVNVPYPSYPWCISPQTYALAQINTIKLIRQILPGVKISSTAPLTVADMQFTDLIAPYVDQWESDMGYWQPSSTYPDSGGGAPLWNDATRQAWLTTLANYSHWTNKPLAFTEWCDQYSDGYITTQFAPWMRDHNVTVSGAWDCFSNNAVTNYKATLGSVPFAGNALYPTVIQGASF